MDIPPACAANTYRPAGLFGRRGEPQTPDRRAFVAGSRRFTAATARLRPRRRRTYRHRSARVRPLPEPEGSFDHTSIRNATCSWLARQTPAQTKIPRSAHAKSIHNAREPARIKLGYNAGNAGTIRLASHGIDARTCVPRTARRIAPPRKLPSGRCSGGRLEELEFPAAANASE